MTLRARLLICFIGISILGSFVGGFGIVYLEKLSDEQEIMYENKTKPLINIIECNTLFGNIRVNAMKILTAGSYKEKSDLSKQILAQLNDGDASLTTLDSSLSQEDLESTIYSDYTSSLEAFSNIVHSILDRVKKRQDQNLGEYFKTKSVQQVITSFYKSSEDFSNYLTIQAEDMTKSVIAKTNKAIIFMVIFTVVNLLISIFIAIWLGSRRISNPLMKITESLKGSFSQIDEAADQLSQSSQEMAGGATEQASGIEEITSSLEELSGMINFNAENASEACKISDSSALTSQKGFNEMEKMIDSMKLISDSSDRIKKIIKVIDDIAFQTNILALNAAVEAARAGEAGMGFAVVADEVKNLANKSLEASKETAEIIEESIERISEGQDVSERLLEAFQKIVELSTDVAGRAKSAESSAAEQATGISQINSAILQFDEVVQENASSAEETAGAAEELQSQVDFLKEIVSKLTLMVTGKADSETKKVSEIKKISVNNENISVQSKAKELIPFEEDEEFAKV